MIRLAYPLILWLGLSLIMPQTAEAGLSTHMQLGKRRYNVSLPDGQKRAFAANETATSLLWRPRRASPLAIGLSHSVLKWINQTDALAPQLLTSYALEGLLWHSLTYRLSPYLRLRYDLLTQTEAPPPVAEDTSGDFSHHLEVNGYHLNLGVKYLIIPIVALLLEIGQGNEIIEDSAGKSRSLTSSTLLVGVEVTILR